MAYWGPPFVDTADEARLACQAALDMLGRVAPLRAELPELLGVKSLQIDCDVRIGIAAGDVLVGSIGSELMMSYTVMGDAVNLASRLEKREQRLRHPQFSCPSRLPHRLVRSSSSVRSTACWWPGKATRCPPSRSWAGRANLTSAQVKLRALYARRARGLPGAALEGGTDAFDEALACSARRRPARTLLRRLEQMELDAASRKTGTDPGAWRSRGRRFLSATRMLRSADEALPSDAGRRLLLCLAPAAAQVGPTASEVSAYAGLHAAAARATSPQSSVLSPPARTRKPWTDGSGRRCMSPSIRSSTRPRAPCSGSAPIRGRWRSTATTSSPSPRSPMTCRCCGSRSMAAAMRVPITSRYDGTALIAAAHLGHAEVVRMLIAAGGPLDHVNNLGWTALIESIVLGDGGRNHTDTLDGARSRRRQCELGRPARRHAARAGAPAWLRGDGRGSWSRRAPK